MLTSAGIVTALRGNDLESRGVGLGVSFVPMRALARYGQKQTLRRIALPVRFEREWVVVRRRQLTIDTPK